MGWYLLLSLLPGAAPVITLAGPVTTGAKPETGLRYWEWNDQGVLFRLTQRLPDQTRAYLLARGFDAGSADLAATRCMFQSMFKNTRSRGAPAVSINLEDWRVHAAGTEKRKQLLTREHWKQVWTQRGVSGAAAIAFEWSLLPTRQEYAPGDYNWGMTSYGLPPGTRFDLDFSWQREGKLFRGRLDGVECPADIHPEPQ
ncbi:MAG TPA: hypothetical protein ENJ80_03850 [Gammaproteobacteria bacterium]|nr:hypothetical protein [Gammaproteobacteria bacterium]